MIYYASLAQEVNHILTASYPVPLDKLHEIVKSIDRETLRLWSDLETCELAPLVEYLCRCWKFDPLAPVLLLRLLRDSETCRTILIAEHQEILPALPGTVDNLLSTSDAAELQIVLLQASLPSGFSSAQDAASHIEALFENRSAQAPDRWLLNVRDVLQSLAVLPVMGVREEAFWNLLTGWNEAIKSSTYSVALAALSVSHAISERSTGSCPNADDIEQQIQRAPALSKMVGVYNKDKGLGVVKLLSRCVLGVSTSEASTGVLSLVEMIDLARNCVEPVDKSVSALVLLPNMGWLNKILSRIESETIPIDLRLAILRFVLAVDPELRVLRFSTIFSTVKQALRALRSGPTGSIEEVVISQLAGLVKEVPDVRQIDRLLLEAAQNQEVSQDTSQVNQAAASAMSKLLVGEVIELTFECCNPTCGPSLQALTHLKSCRMLVDTIRSLVAQESGIVVAESIVEKINQTSMPPWWSQKSFLKGNAESCAQGEICTSTFENTRQVVSNALSDLVIWSACSSREILRCADLSSLQWQMKRQDNAAVPCHYRQHRGKPSRSDVFDLQPQRPSTNEGNNSLQSGLSDLGTTVTAQVEEIIYKHCKDLQKRCDTTEQPLRYLQEEVRNLQLQLSAKTAEIASAQQENQVLSTNHQIALAARDIEFQNAQASFTEALEACRRKVEQLVGALGTSEQEREACESGLRKLAKSNSRLRNQYTILQRSLTETSEEATRARDSVESTERFAIQRSARYEDEIKALSVTISDLEQENQLRNAEIKSLLQQVTLHSDTISEQSQLIYSLQEMERTKEQLIASLKSSLEEAKVERETSIQTVETDYTSRIAKLQDDFDKAMQDLGEDHEGQLRGLRESHDCELQQSKAETLEMAQDVSKKDTVIAELEASLLKNREAIRESTEALIEAKKQIVARAEAWKAKEKILLGQLEKARKTQTSVLAMLQGKPIGEDEAAGKESGFVTNAGSRIFE